MRSRDDADEVCQPRRLPVMARYLAATCGSFFVSSHRVVRLFGVLALASFIVAYLFYARALVSVWCFFAAILSVVIYGHLRYRNLGVVPTPTTPGVVAG